MICYDSEFPELARHLVNQGAMLLFVPFCTDERRGYLRVRYCCQARAVDNQCSVITSGVVGNLPNVENIDRKSVVAGKGVSVRVDHGGRRIITKQTKTKE